MRPINVTVGPYQAGSANNIALAQTRTAAGAFTLNGSLVGSNGWAVLDAPRQVGFTSVGNDSGITFTVYGADSLGNLISETFPGANVGLALSNNFFKIVTGASSSGPTAANVTIGTTSGPAASSMIRLDDFADAPLGIQVAVSGAVNYTVQHSFDNPNDLISPVPVASMFWDTSLVPAGAIAGTAGISFSMATAPVFMRILLNSGAGSARLTILQYNVVEG